MSCHSTSGGIVSTSLARGVSGLSEKEVQHLFHALKRESAGMAAPSELAVQEWRSRQYDLLSRMKRMSDTRRDKLRDRLFRSRGESVPDGATFHAWATIEARARQEAALRQIGTAVDLEPPGSQAHLYDLGEDVRPSRVWYASYGSNLHRDRFMNYIEGGSPEGSTRTYDGCSDPTPPLDDIPIRFAGARPHFALTSRVWGGGIAFIDAQKGETAQGLGRAYDISIDQFDEVVAQENGLPTAAATPVPLDEALGTGRSVIGNGSYETILHIGDYQGAPVLTFTAPFSTREALTRTGHIVRQANPKATPVRMPVMTNKPSVAYLRMIGGGLQETFGMDEVAQADYLRGCAGGDRWSRQQMVRILRGEDPDPPRATAPEEAPAQTKNGKKGGKTPNKASDKAAKGSRGEDPTSGYVVTKRSTDPETGRRTSATDPVFSHATTAPGTEPGSVLDDLRQQGLFPDTDVANGTRSGRGRSTQKSGARSSTVSAGTRTALAGDQPRSTGSGKQSRPPAVRTRRRGGERQLPGVKTYGSVEEQSEGVRRWRRTVTDMSRTRDSIRGAVASLERGMKELEGSGSPARVEATRLNLEKSRARLEEAERLVSQAGQRLQQAESQRPARYYARSSRSAADWKAEEERLVVARRSLEAVLDARQRSWTDLMVAEGSSDRAIEKALQNVERLQEDLAEQESRISEVRKILSGR